MTPNGVELTVQSEPEQSAEAFLVMNWEPILAAIRSRGDIARAEFRKQRKRLGVLSAEQETAIEALLMTTVNHFTEPELLDAIGASVVIRNMSIGGVDEERD